MKKYALISYNMYCNFTNYGSALHTWALQRVINSLSPYEVSAVILDYCPDVLKDKDVLNPFKNLWDKDEESRRMVELSMPAIRINNDKFNNFYHTQLPISKGKYTSENFNDSLQNEDLYGYVCGSDTIWCIREFKCFDDGYFGNYPVMKKSHTVSYAPSFGDVDFTAEELKVLADRMQNFKAISVRENQNLDFIKAHTDVEVVRVLDPTLLLTGRDYEAIMAPEQEKEPYVLLYSRRYDKDMEVFADDAARKLGCKVVEISIRATNADRHEMRYDAGVEEFLSLVKGASLLVTNSFHGAIFAIQMHTQLRVFSREQADSKIKELLELLALENVSIKHGASFEPIDIDFERVEAALAVERERSIGFLKRALEVGSN